LRDRLAVAKGTAALHGRPLLVRAEVVDVAEEDVVDRVALGDRDREAEVGDPALGVLRAVDRVDEHRVAALAAVADLLRDDADVVAVEVAQRRRLGGLVERGGQIAALALADDALALLAAGHGREHALDVRDGRAAELEPGAHSGWKSR